MSSIIRIKNRFFKMKARHVDSRYHCSYLPWLTIIRGWVASMSDKGLMVMGDEKETAVISQTKAEVREPSLYKVLLLNDDYTPMDFVVQILREVFHKESSVANQIMLDVHKKGFGVCGIYTYEVAETKTSLVLRRARESEFPLQCSIERSE